MKQFRALLFDVDGTLAETEEFHRRAFNEAFAYFGINWVWDIAIYRQLLRVTGGRERIRQFSSLHPGVGYLSDDEIAALHLFKNARYAQLIAAGACELRPGVADLIRATADREQQLGIVTTTSRANVEALLAPKFGREWPEIFGVIVSGGNVDLARLSEWLGGKPAS